MNMTNAAISKLPTSEKPKSDMIVLNGETENTQVDCLVDTGASANYISEAVYKTLDHNSIDS